MTNHSLWQAFVETLRHWAYWVIALAILFGGIAWFSRRDAWRKTGGRQKR